jgi:hypothetical protein
MSSTSTETASALLSKTNELLADLARLNSNVELYTQVHSLQQNFNSLEEKYNSFQNNIKNSKCKSQCKNLNATSESNGVEGFLAQLLLSKSNPPPTVLKDAAPLPVNDYQASVLNGASAPPLEPPLEASAPP